MNFIMLSAALLLTPAIDNNPGGEGPDRFPVDAKQSTVQWEGRKVTGSHSGDIQVSSGFVTVENGLISAATVTIDMTTINTTDLDGGAKESLDGHLSSDDFFSVESFPTARFELMKIDPLRGGEGGANFTAMGTVTIKGRTDDVAVPVKVEMTETGARISGDLVLDRSKFDVRFRSKSFFDASELGDKLIYDDFTIHFELVAGK